MSEPKKGPFGLPSEPPDLTKSQGHPEAPAPEKPEATSDPEPKAPETAPEKDTPTEPEAKQPEKDADRSQKANEHYQTRYQKAMEYIAQNHPEVRDELRQAVKEPSKPEPRPEPTTKTDGAAPDPYEDPAGYADYVAERSAARIRAELESQRQQESMTAQERQLHKEMQDAEREFVAFVEPNEDEGWSGVPGDVRKKAIDTARQYGIDVERPGGPTRFLSAVVNEIDRLMVKKTMNTRATELAGEAAANAKKAMLMGQPESKGAINPSGEPSPKQKHLDQMMGVKGISLSEMMTKK